VNKTPLTDLSVEALQAMHAELETETKRRLDERVERGEVLRESLVAVCAGPDDADDAVEGAKALRLAQLREVGDEREVVFDPIEVLLTGVPRPGRDDKYVARLEREKRDRESEAACAEHIRAQSVAAREPAPYVPPPTSKSHGLMSLSGIRWAYLRSAAITCGAIITSTTTAMRASLIDMAATS
jgi:hypothetical protein